MLLKRNGEEEWNFIVAFKRLLFEELPYHDKFNHDTISARIVS